MLVVTQNVLVTLDILVLTVVQMYVTNRIAPCMVLALSMLRAKQNVLVILDILVLTVVQMYVINRIAQTMVLAL
jgi:hypothetical protein